MKSYLIFSFFISFFLFSCNDTDKAPTSESRNIIMDLALTEEYAEDITVIFDEAAIYGKLVTKDNYFPSDMPVVIKKYYDSIQKTDTLIVVDFGIKGVMSKDDKTRSGKVKISMPRGYNFAGTIQTISFEGFSINGTILSGKKTIRYNGVNSSSFKEWTVVNDLSYAKKDGTVLNLKGEQRRTWTNPTNQVWTQRTYKYEGVYEQYTRKNIVYNFDVTKALQVSIGCRHFQSGILSFKKDLKTYKITYDKTLISGCDNFADIEYEGTTETINLVL
jgi:hypothetical protein